MSDVSAHLSPRQLAWVRFKRHRMAVAGATVLIALYLLAAFCEFISPYTPEKRNIRAL